MEEPVAPTRRLHVHPSAMPAAVRARRLAALASGRVAPGFLYDSLAQATRWLQVHEAHSPARSDPAVRSLYGELGRRLNSHPDVVLSLGCGGGAKDQDLLAGLWSDGPGGTVMPLDTSPALALQGAAAVEGPGRRVQPWIADLEAPLFRNELGISDRATLGVFALGLAPNFAPDRFFGLLDDLLRPGEFAVISVNTSPEAFGGPSTERIRRQYDNAETRAWLLGGLNELGLSCPRLRYDAAPTGPGTWQIRVDAELEGPRSVELLGTSVQLPPSLRVLESNRVHAEALHDWLGRYGYRAVHTLRAPSDEESVLAVRPQE